jgi:peptidoglycan/xylan/chitin deacetylase (PgdA/CDA1 family)
MFKKKTAAAKITGYGFLIVFIIALSLLLVLLIFKMFSIEKRESRQAEQAKASMALPQIKKVDIAERILLFGETDKRLGVKANVLSKGATNSGVEFYSSDSKIAQVSRKGVVTAKRYGDCKIYARSIDNPKKKDFVNVAVKKKWIALTFDDGPKKTSASLFKYIKKKNIQATIFMIGMRVEKEKSLVKKEYASKLIEIGNHSYTHTYFWKRRWLWASKNPLRDEVEKTDRLLKKITGKKSTVFRPPGGNIDSETLAIKKPIILWSVDPRDWKRLDAGYVYNYVKKNAGSGDIVLMHDVYGTTVKAAKRLISYYKKHGYFFATVTQILGGKPKAGKVYTRGAAKPKTMKIY